MRAILEKFYSADTVVAASKSSPQMAEISKHSFGKKAPSSFRQKPPAPEQPLDVSSDHSPRN